MSAADSIRKFSQNLIKTKVIGKRFKTYRWSTGVTFCDDGPFIVRDVSFDWSTFTVPSDVEYNDFPETVPVYELYVSVTKIDTNEEFYWKIDIRDIP